MNMTKLVFFLSLLVSYNVTATDENGFWDSLYKFFWGTLKSDKQKPKINYRVLEETVGMIIDTALGTDEQSKEIRAGILKFKEMKIPVIIKKLQSMRLNDYYEAIDQARTLTYGAIALHIGERAADYAQEQIPHSPYLQEIKQEFIDKAGAQKKETYCGLCHLYGEQLKQEVQEKIREYSQTQ